MSNQPHNDALYNGERPYTRVEQEQLDRFLRILIENPFVQIKDAARATHIKYQRATALWRQHRSFVMERRQEYEFSRRQSLREAPAS